jgi:gamma-glutamylcyclotransferase (GGCT)/AIG2-like uncharacterized protein YtfP
VSEAAGQHIFVYGSLRSDVPKAARTASGRRAYELLASGAELQGKATLPGFLYAITWYPGFIGARSGGRVAGEVWRMRDPRVLLGGLDAYEGDGYTRERRSARLDDGRRISSWVYIYAGDVSRALKIDSGDYLDWVRTKEST